MNIDTYKWHALEFWFWAKAQFNLLFYFSPQAKACGDSKPVAIQSLWQFNQSFQKAKACGDS